MADKVKVIPANGSSLQAYVQLIARNFEHIYSTRSNVKKAKSPQSKKVRVLKRDAYTDEKGEYHSAEYDEITIDKYYSGKFSAYNSAVERVRSNNLIGQVENECYKINTTIREVIQACQAFSDFVASSTSKNEIVKALNAIGGAGSIGRFALVGEGEDAEVRYNYYPPEGGGPIQMTMSELVKCFYTTFGAVMNGEYSAALTDVTENGGDGKLTLDQQQAVYDKVTAVVDFARDTHAYRQNNLDDVLNTLKDVYGDKYNVTEDDDLRATLQKMGVDYDTFMDAAAESGLAFGGVVTVAADFSDAYDLTETINEKPDVFEMIEDGKKLTEEERKEIKDELNIDDDYHVKPNEEPTEPTNPKKGKDQEDSGQQDQEVLGEDEAIRDKKPGGGGDKQPEPSGGGGDTGTPSNPQPSDPGTPSDPGSTPGDTTPSSDIPTSTTPSRGLDPSPTDRTPAKDLLSYDSVVDQYITGTPGGDGNLSVDSKAFEYDLVKDYENMTLEDYGNSSDTGVKVASILAVVTEANNLFDNNQALLSKKLFGMGYSESEVAEIMQDRDLTIQAFTKNANNQQTEADNKKTATRKKLYDSVNGYKKAVDDANEALANAKDLKSKLDGFTEKYGEDYTKWTDEQYNEYTELAKQYNEAVADAKTKVEAVEIAKGEYNSAKGDFETLEAETQVSTGMSDGDVTTLVSPESSGPTSSEGMNDPQSLFGNEIHTETQTSVSSGNISSGVEDIVTSTSSASLEDPMNIMGDNNQTVDVDSAVEASVNTGANVLKNLNATENTESSIEGIDPLPETSIDMSQIDTSSSVNQLDLEDTSFATSDSNMVNSHQSASIVENIADGIKSNLPAELISVGAIVAVKGITKLINGDKNKQFVINYDELARYKYEKIDQNERAAQENGVINETEALFAVDKILLKQRLMGFGFSENDANVIIGDKQLATLAMLDGARRQKLSELAKELADEDGIKDYQSNYMANASVSSLTDGTALSLRVDLSDSSFDQLRDEYFNVERKYVDFANAANKDLAELKEAKTKYDSFINEHGSNSGNWTNEEYKTYEMLNNANIDASKAFEDSNRKLGDIEGIFADMKNRYEIEKASKISKKVDPTNIKELMNQPITV